MRTLLLLLCVAALSTVASAQTFQLEGTHLVVDQPVVFKAGTAELLPQSEAGLQWVKTYLDQKTYITLMRIEGHVASGSNAQALSEKRAAAVVKWLGSHGVDCQRLLATGFGATKPAAAAGDAGSGAGDRIVFANAALRGRPIGGEPVDGGGRVVASGCQ